MITTQLHSDHDLMLDLARALADHGKKVEQAEPVDAEKWPVSFVADSQERYCDGDRFGSSVVPRFSVDVSALQEVTERIIFGIDCVDRMIIDIGAQRSFRAFRREEGV